MFAKSSSYEFIESEPILFSTEKNPFVCSWQVIPGEIAEQKKKTTGSDSEDLISKSGLQIMYPCKVGPCISWFFIWSELEPL